VDSLFQILKKDVFSQGVKRFIINAPEIAKKAGPDQFVVLRIDEKGERVPLTISDSDPEKGTISMVFQEVGKSTMQLGMLNEGDYIRDVIGPLGTPAHIEKFGTVACVGGGVGIAVLPPVVKALRKAGNKVITILGARTKGLLILEDDLRKISDELYVVTDDGSYGTKGLVTNELELLIKAPIKIDLVIAIGPAVMMRAVANLTRNYNIKTIASINSIMVDGTGMCGACRVSVRGKTKFACVDGPEFDAHDVDFDELIKRLAMYKKDEKVAVEHYKAHQHKHHHSCC
jgi:ferredoxin--NADP+ reductase